MTAAIEPIAWTPDVLAASAPQTDAVGNLTGDFAGLLKAGVATLDAQGSQAASMLSAYAAGERLSPHELVMAMEQAKLSMQLAVEVRNRLVDAYQELTRMQI